ncbi:hypothetical protein EX30DRAFT_89815 [Ascodesmis nigricans]|uniref:Mitochondrial ATPase inhibitor n=1 Tax=Ascodesmis nigricans TaxID=341454 RepID=A0A4S2N3F8_9PEZI|nr:hypothetical protein EX30DRAFT_89815 [Ascodesmis nigricans]
MSFVIKSSPAGRTALGARLHISGFSSSARRLVGGATRHNNDPDVLEKGKQDILRKHSKGSNEEPHWHEELASDAEAFVKAQRDEIEGANDQFRKLQEKTARVGKEIGKEKK